MENQVKVNIKMYRVNELGDCFFLCFTHNDKSSNILIDCGSFRNNEKSKVRMNNIAKNIQTHLGKGKNLSVVIGTHQHNDHLSGFVHAESVFKKIRAEEAWLSWLDNPKDKEAQKIEEGQQKLSLQLQKIGDELECAQNQSFKNSKAKERLSDVLGFYHAASSEQQLHNVPYVPAKGLENLKSISSEVKYLEPGQIVNLPGLDEGAVKVYVLGPPRNKALLYDKDPKKGESYDHKLSMASTLAENFLSALTNFSGQTVDPDEEQFPFNNSFEKSLKTESSKLSQYLDPKKVWQKIDEEWLDQAERLALYMDSYTNNSSLVLAFELVNSGKVLLFVGDAQTGNWLSWKDIPWETPIKGFSTSDLLTNTVLYKVGHHCSHNATLVENLEKMKHPELVAMIPVDRNDPHIIKTNGWKMPATNLHKRLKEKTNNRVLVMDKGWDTDCDPENSAKDSWSKLPYKPKMNDLYIEYEIEG